MKNITRIASVTTISLSIALGSVFAYADSSQVTSKYNVVQTVESNGRTVTLPSTFNHRSDQFRGVWISTVFNLDLPSKKNMTESEYKTDYRAMLDQLEKLNMNAVIFQVRPKADAFYESDINPWSEYLTGSQGKSPGWDPMSWMIEETHRRGMEFHAWFNPYRVTAGNQTLSSLSDKNWAKKNPSKVMDYGGKLYLNPGEPEVVKHITDTVMEVVRKYDIDAVHFDDYFYPSKSKADVENFYTSGERNTFNTYKRGAKSVSSWRRDNVTRLIRDISTSIESFNKQNNRDVEFGISPFGIWGHEKDHPAGSIEGKGSNTPQSSTASYDNHFADTRKWVKEGLIDYICPQVYWTFNEVAAPYGNITEWWAETVKGTDVDLYIGHASYKKANKSGTDKEWKNSEEILNQLKFNSLYDEVDGSIFFRYKSMLESAENADANNVFLQKLKGEYFNSKTKTKKQLKGENIVDIPETPVKPELVKEIKYDLSDLKPVLVEPIKVSE